MPKRNGFVVPYYSMLCVFIAVLNKAIYNFLKQILVNKEGFKSSFNLTETCFTSHYVFCKTEYIHFKPSDNGYPL